MTTPILGDAQSEGVEVQLAAIPETVSAARRFTITTLQKWAVHDEAIEVAELLVSELVTNAVEQTQHFGPWVPGEVEPKPPETPAVVWLRVRVNEMNLVVEVWDNNLTPPVPQPQHFEAEHGRGLLLVARLSRRWGYYWPEAGGKIVWAEAVATR